MFVCLAGSVRLFGGMVIGVINCVYRCAYIKAIYPTIPNTMSCTYIA